MTWGSRSRRNRRWRNEEQGEAEPRHRIRTGGRKEGWKRADVTRNDGARTVEKNESGGKARVEGRWWIGAPPSVAPSRGSLTPDRPWAPTPVSHPPRSGSRSQGWKSPAILLIVGGPRPTTSFTLFLYFPSSLSIFLSSCFRAFISVPFSFFLVFVTFSSLFHALYNFLDFARCFMFVADNDGGLNVWIRISGNCTQRS